MLNDEAIPVGKSDLAVLENFLATDFEKIKEAFNTANYPETKIKLSELVRARLKLMFPKLKDRF